MTLSPAEIWDGVPTDCDTYTAEEDSAEHVGILEMRVENLSRAESRAVIHKQLTVRGGKAALVAGYGPPGSLTIVPVAIGG